MSTLLATTVVGVETGSGFAFAVIVPTGDHSTESPKAFCAFNLKLKSEPATISANVAMYSS